MKSKYSLNIDDPYSENIVKFAESSSMYCDDQYYQKHMGECCEKPSF